MVKLYAIMCAVSASLAALSLGLDVGMISSTIIQPKFLAYFDHPSSDQLGGIVAAFSAGATFGAFGCSYLGDPLGRVWAMRIGAMIAIVGCALQSGSVHVAMLAIGRLVNGYGAGILTAVFPIYASEVAPPTIRGAFGGLQMLMIETAIFVATATGYAFGKYYSDDIQWRGPLAVQAIPLLALVPVTFLLPETPRWLLQNNAEEEALRILSRIYNCNDSNQVVQDEFNEIKIQIEAEKISYTPSWKEILTRPSWRRRALLVMGLQFFSQVTGINCVQYYAASIYTQLGFNTSQSLLINLLYGAFGLLSSLFWVSILDRFKRVRLLIFSTCLIGVSLIITAVLSAKYVSKSQPNPNALRAEVAMFFIFQLAFVAVGMLAWLIPPEMCPMVIRAKVNSVGVSANNVTGLVVALISPIGLEAIEFSFFYVFVAFNVLGLFFYLFLVPETSNLTLEEMNTQFGDHIVSQGTDETKGEDIVHQESA